MPEIKELDKENREDNILKDKNITLFKKVFNTFNTESLQPLFTLKINKHTYKKRYHNTPKDKI